MAIKSYLITANVDCPFVEFTGIAYNPNRVRVKSFKRGEIIRGELKHANNKPAFVLVDGKVVVPITAIKEVVAKEIISEAEGKTITQATENIKKVVLSQNPKVQYMDAVILGSLLGFGAVVLAEKKGWIGKEGGEASAASPEANAGGSKSISGIFNQNRLIGGAIGGLLSFYLVYRYRQNKATKAKEE